MGGPSPRCRHCSTCSVAAGAVVRLRPRDVLGGPSRRCTHSSRCRCSCCGTLLRHCAAAVLRLCCGGCAAAVAVGMGGRVLGSHVLGQTALRRWYVWYVWYAGKQCACACVRHG